VPTAPPTAATWPARYRLHKYWSRKPGDAVGAAIERWTQPGDVVLDPFCGSGVTPFEAHARGRRAVALDLNPFAVALTRATLARCDPDGLAAAGRAVLEEVEAREGVWHRTRCRRCGADAGLAGTARRGSLAVAVLVRCAACGARGRHVPEAADLRLAEAAERAGAPGAPRPPVFAGWQTRKLRRAGLHDFGELFTTRNLRAFTALRTTIAARPAGPVRDLLALALTGALAQGSRMMADHSAAGGGASWKLNVYWLPERSLELDPLRCFANRLERVVAAKRESERLLADAGGPSPVVRCGDARDVDRLLAPGSVRYVFADPPYGGEGIQYAELSALWCAWLDPPLEPPLDAEIGVNPVRGRNWTGYADGLAAAFGAIRRVLADDGRLTVTFASGSRRAWRALDDALRAARFEVVAEESRSRSAPALTERTSPRSTRADAWLDCRPR
jgi:adenine-specific DNA methylase